MTLVPTDKSRDKLKENENILRKVEDLIRSINNNSENYDEKFVKIKFNSDNDLPLKKTLALYDII